MGSQDFNKVSSAYAKDVNPKGFLEKSNVLYASPDTKITQSALNSFGFKLASSELNRLGSIGKITYDGGKVKMQGVPFRQIFGEAGRGGEYSIAVDEKSRKYVQQDRDVLEGNDPKKWGQQLYDYINQKIRKGQDVVVTAEDGTPLTIREKTAWKMSDRHVPKVLGTKTDLLSTENYETKLNAAGHIDELSRREYGP